MPRSLDLNELVVTVGTGMKIGPGDRRGVGIIALGRQAWVDVFAVEMMGGADFLDPADGTSQIHMIAREHQSAAATAEVRYRAAVFRSEPIARVHREQPELIELAALQARQHRIGCTRRVAVARRYVE